MAVRSLPELRRRLRRCDAGGVVVVGDRAMAEERPEQIERMVVRQRAILLVVPRSAPLSRSVGWARRTSGRVVEPAGLDVVIHEAAQEPLRPEVEFRLLAGLRPTARRGSRRAFARLRKALASVPGLDGFKTWLWAAAEGVHPNTLALWCREARVNFTPQEILWAYVVALATACVRRGDSKDLTARCCGYSSRMSLERAFRLHGTPWPVTGRRLRRHVQFGSPDVRSGSSRGRRRRA